MLREFSLNVVSQGNSVKVTQSGLLKRQVKLLSTLCTTSSRYFLFPCLRTRVSGSRQCRILPYYTSKVTREHIISQGNRYCHEVSPNSNDQNLISPYRTNTVRRASDANKANYQLRNIVLMSHQVPLTITARCQEGK